MKKLLFISISIILYTSCASSQNAVITKEAQQKVDKMKPILAMTDTQVEKMVAIEADYIKASKNLTYNSTYNSKLNTLKENRITRIKEILSRDQYIKFDIIENDRIKRVPVRF